MKLPNGFGSIHLIEKGAKKKRRKPYRARVLLGYTSEGKPMYENVGYFATQIEAYDALVAYHKNPLAKKEDITVAEVYQMLCDTSFKNLSTSRLQVFNSIYKTHIGPLYNVKVQDVKSSSIKAIITNKSPNIQKEIVGLMKKILNAAMEDEYIDKNVAELVKLNSVQQATVKKQKSKSFTDEEIKKLWVEFRTNKKNKNVPVVLFMLYTGIRVGELSGLKRVGNSFVGGIKTDAGKNRTIPIHPDIEEVIPYVDFNRQQPTIYNYLKTYFDHKVHDTRHTFVSNMRKNDISSFT